jgi:hypothetical protein
MSRKPQTMGSGVMTVIYWVLVISAALLAIDSLRKGNIVEAIVCMFVAVVVIIAVHTPKWLERFLP